MQSEGPFSSRSAHGLPPGKGSMKPASRWVLSPWAGGVGTDGRGGRELGSTLAKVQLGEGDADLELGVAGACNAPGSGGFFC